LQLNRISAEKLTHGPGDRRSDLLSEFPFCLSKKASTAWQGALNAKQHAAVVGFNPCSENLIKEVECRRSIPQGHTELTAI